MSKIKTIQRISIGVCAALVAIAAPLQLAPTAHADKYDDQIRALQREIDSYQPKLNELKTQVATLQGEIQAIDSQKQILLKQIELNEAKHNKLNEDIARTEKQITENKAILGKLVADLHIDDSISPLEMLASSHNVAEFVDKQEMKTSITDKLNAATKKIKTLKQDLDKQKVDVQRVLADQDNTRQALQAKEDERNTILAQTQGEENNYKQVVNSREAQKLKVQQQQQAAMEAALYRAGGGRGPVVLPGTSGGYPWNASNCYVDGNAMSHGGIDGNGTDGMGYGCRQCTSYAAWRAYKESGYAPVQWGDAVDFPARGAAAGFTVSGTPRENSIAVMTSTGRPGHVAWVESVDPGSGTMIVSQYNYYNAGGPGWGNYSKMQVSVGAYQKYVYF
jgi:surface antigen/peptidoglycan hydrolase CwlO-like protein